jgi:phytoene dehydrogenase-like protein
METFDVIVIGSGNNGLTVANYLSKAGQSVLVLERRLEEGGGLSTEQIFPGYYFNLHSVFHIFGPETPAYQDFELDKYGASYIVPHKNFGIPLRDGRCLLIYSDREDTYRSLSKFSEKDARTLVEMERYYEVMRAYHYAPPLPTAEWRDRLEQRFGALGTEFFDLAQMSPTEVTETLFEDDTVRTSLFFSTSAVRMREALPATGFGTLRMLLRLGRYGLARGGSNMIAKALVNFLTAHGGKIRQQSSVERILVEQGRAVGVRLEGGAEYRARKAVVSNVDPGRTFLQMVGEEHLPKEEVERVKGWRMNESALFGAHMVLREPPRYTVAEKYPDMNECFHQTFGYDVPEEMLEHFREIEAGRVPSKPGGEAWVPTLFDRSQGPGGFHTAGFWQFVPYEVDGRDPEYWNEIKESYFDRILDRWAEYAPNMTRENVVHRYSYTPLDNARAIINMVRGDDHMGTYSGGQVGIGRQPYRTPLEGLYMTGSCCHPGGSITFAPGYNAVNVIAEDLKLKRWWPKPKFLEGYGFFEDW